MKRTLAFLALLIYPALAEAQIGTARYASSTPAVNTVPYSANDVVGALLTFDNLLRTTQPTGFLLSACVYDKAAQAADLELVILSEPFSSATTLTNNSPFDPADADLPKILHFVALGSTSRANFLDNGVKCVTVPALPVISTGTNKKALYGVLVSRGTPTLASTSDITVTIGVSRD